MEMTECLTELADLLTSFSDLVKPVRNIQSFQGSELYVKDLIAKIRGQFVVKGLFNSDFSVCPGNEDSIRRVLCLLAINVETLDLSSVLERPIHRFVDEVPKISMNLFYMLIWGLKLQDYFLEFISFAPLSIVVNYMVILPDAMKHLDKEKDLEFAQKFTVAFYRNITNPRNFEYDTDGEIASGYCWSYLKDYFEADPETYPHLSSSKFAVHLGHMIKHMLKICINCLKYFKKDFNEEGGIKIYNRAFFGEDQKTEEEKYEPVMENGVVLKFNERLFTKLQILIDGVSVMVFCEWVDVTVEPKITLQQIIKELATTFLSIPNEENNLKHEIFKQIAFLTVNSSSKRQEANQASIGEILNQLETVETPETKSLWLGELISRGELVLENEECLEMIEKNFAFLKLSDYTELARFLQNSNSGNEEMIRDILLSGVEKLPVDDAVELVSSELLYLPASTMQTHDFESKLEAFLQGQRWKESEYLKLLAQNPHRVIEKITLHVIDSLEHEKDMKMSLKFLQMTEKITGLFLEENLKDIICSSKICGPDDELNKLTGKWICRLFNCGLLNKSNIIKTLTKSLANNISNRNEKGILSIINIFSHLAMKSSFGEDSIKVAAMAGLVLDKSRWNLFTYTDEIRDITKNTIVFVLETMKSILRHCSQMEKDTLAEKIKSFSPMTTFYFRKLKLDKSDNAALFAEHIFDRDSLKDLPSSELQNFLFENLLCTTPKETIWLLNNDYLRPLFEPTLAEIAAKVDSLPQAERLTPVNCFRNCMLNYIPAIQKKLVAVMEDKHEALLLLHRILDLCSAFPEEINKELMDNLFPLLSLLLGDILNEKEPISGCHSVLKDQVTVLKLCPARDKLMIMFKD